MRTLLARALDALLTPLAALVNVRVGRLDGWQHESAQGGFGDAFDTDLKQLDTEES